MAAYVVVDATRTDLGAPPGSKLPGPSVERHGGRFLARGGATVVLEEDRDPERVVIIEFPSVDAARAWYESDDYREARTVCQGPVSTGWS